MPSLGASRKNYWKFTIIRIGETMKVKIERVLVGLLLEKGFVVGSFIGVFIATF